MAPSYKEEIVPDKKFTKYLVLKIISMHKEVAI